MYRKLVLITNHTARPTARLQRRIAASLVEWVWPQLAEGMVRMHIRAVYPLDEIRSAHAELDANRQIGKVALVRLGPRAEQKLWILGDCTDKHAAARAFDVFAHILPCQFRIAVADRIQNAPMLA